MSEDIRIDKWLWAVRLFKTRSLASDFCKKGKILINGIAAKPSRLIKIGDILVVKKTPVNYTYKVKGLIGKRVGATIAIQHVEDLTPEKELQKLKKAQESASLSRDRGLGRPTKKDRRDLDKYQI